jgi:hypothetical protein
MTVQINRPKFQPKRDGYIAKIATWGMNPCKKERFLNGNHDGCPMFWRFLFMFVWSLGALRDDGVKQSYDETGRPTKINQTMLRVNEAVSDFSETKTAQYVGKGIGMIFSGAFILTGSLVVLVFVLAIGKAIYSIFAGGRESILQAGGILGIAALGILTCILLWKGIARLVRWIDTTEAWALFVQKLKGLKEKTCPVVTFA